MVQAFLKKWWVESDFKAPNLPHSLRLNVELHCWTNCCLLTIQPGIYVYHGRVSKLYIHDKDKYQLQGKVHNHKVKAKQGEYKIIANEKIKQINYTCMLKLTKNSGLRICIVLTTWNMSTSSSISIFSKTRLRATNTPLLLHPSLLKQNIYLTMNWQFIPIRLYFKPIM